MNIKKYVVVFVIAVLAASSLYITKKEEEYDVLFPISFLSSGLPTVEVKIEGAIYPLMLDLGSDSVLSLRQSVLGNIEKKPQGKAFISDVKGNTYEIATYLIPELKIGKLKATHIPTDEECDEFLDQGAMLFSKPQTASPPEKIGRIGRAFFENQTNLFFDIAHSVIYGCSKLKLRKKDGYKIERMISIPFELNKSTGITIKAETELGVKTFMLDTGASKSILKPSNLLNTSTLEYKLSQFKIGKEDFGPQNFLIFDIAAAFQGIDGILGMDFCKEHVFYIDFKTKIFFLGNAKEVGNSLKHSRL